MSLFDRVVLLEYGEKTRFKRAQGGAFHPSDVLHGKRFKTTKGFFVDKGTKRYPNVDSLSQALGALRQAYTPENPGAFGGSKAGAGANSKLAMALAKKIHARHPNVCPSILAVAGKCEKPSPLSVYHGGKKHGEGGNRIDDKTIWPCSVGKGCPEKDPKIGKRAAWYPGK